MQHQLFAKQRALPDLCNNIKCGNSLIGTDFNDDALMFEDDEVHRTNAFDWTHEFPRIMLDGGFSAIIGNPPYGFHRIHEEVYKKYFRSHFLSSKGSFEHYFLFYERTLRLLREKGLHGFIVPVTWLSIPSAKALRQFVLNNYHIESIDWLPELVFANAQVNTLVSIISRDTPGITQVSIHESLGFRVKASEVRDYNQSDFIKADHYIGIFEEGVDTEVLTLIESKSQPLGSLAVPCSGYNPYEIGKGVRPDAGGGPHTAETVKTKPYHSGRQIDESWSEEIVGRDLSRFSINSTGSRWVKYGNWLAAPRDPNNFCGPRILVQEIVGGKERRIVAAYTEKTLHHSRDIIPIKISMPRHEALFLLGILNSYLMTWFHHKRNPKAKKGLFPKVLVSDLRKMPINWKIGSGLDTAIADVVEKIMLLEERKRTKKVSHEILNINRQISALDSKLDKLVYEVYGLNEAQIAIVEKSKFKDEVEEVEKI